MHEHFQNVYKIQTFIYLQIIIDRLTTKTKINDSENADEIPYC